MWSKVLVCVVGLGVVLAWGWVAYGEAARCAVVANFSSCARQPVLERLHQSPLAGMSAFEKLLSFREDVRGISPAECHLFAHEMGDRAVVLYPEPSEALSATSDALSVCGYGYYHAYLEAYFEAHPVSSRVDAVCETVGEGSLKAPAIRQVCFGSAGSGFVRSALRATPHLTLGAGTSVLKDVLRQCDALQEEAEGRLACYKGAFGQLVYQSITSVSATSSMQSFDAFCSQFRGSERLACIDKTAEALYVVPFAQVSNLAEFARYAHSREEWKVFVVGGISALLAHADSRKSSETLLRGCVGLVPEEWCVQGVVEALHISDYAVRGSDHASLFCASPAVATLGLERNCYQALWSVYAQEYVSQAAHVRCEAFPPEYRYLCASAKTPKS